MYCSELMNIVAISQKFTESLCKWCVKWCSFLPGMEPGHLCHDSWHLLAFWFLLFGGRCLCCDVCGSCMTIHMASELRNVDEKTAASIRLSLTLISKSLIRTIVEAIICLELCWTMLNYVEPCHAILNHFVWSCFWSQPVLFRTRTRKNY